MIRKILGTLGLMAALLAAPTPAAHSADTCGSATQTRLGFDVAVAACLVYRNPPSGAYFTAVPKADVQAAAGYASHIEFCAIYWEIFRGSAQIAHGQASCTYNAQRGLKDESGWTISRLQSVSAGATYMRTRLLVIFDGQRYWTWARHTP
jgi:hypothetical protein